MLRKPERLLKKGQFGKAISILEKLSHKKNHNDPKLLLRLAAAYKANNEFSKTEDVLQNAVRKFPDNFILIFNLGKFYIENEKFEPACECFEKSINLSKDNLLAKSYYALSLLGVGRYDESVKIFKEYGIDTNTEFLILFSLIGEEIILKNPDIFPESSIAGQWIENDWLINLYNSGNSESIIKTILKPFVVNKILNRAEKTMFYGNFDGAIELLDYLLKIAPDNENALLGKAIVFFNQKKFEEARNLFIHLVNIKGENPLFLTHIGICSYFLNEYDYAENIFKQITCDGPEDYTKNYFSAMTASSKKDKINAMKYFQIAHTTFFFDTAEQCLKPLMNRILRYKKINDS